MSKRILVVEDQPDNRQIIRDMLAPTDYEITEAEDGQQALETITKQRPDLILMDIQLPIIDGYTATRKIRPIPHGDRSRSSPSPPMRSAGRRRRRAKRAVMTTFRSPSVHVNYWQKSVSICPRLPVICCTAYVRFWHKADIAMGSINVRFWG